ncbi:MAG: GNAT family N-acetyltransferase [Spirochaetales bacterium]
MELQDKMGKKYSIHIMKEEDNFKKIIISKINELWMQVDESLLSHYLSTKYSCDELPTTFVVTDEDKLVGFCSLLRTDVAYRTDIFPWFGNCFVLEKYRHMGIMTAMQEFVCQYANEKGFKKIYLWTEDNTLYLKAGWKYLENIQVDKNINAYLFYKNIK